MKFIKEITLFAPSGTLKRFQGLETSFKVEQGKISALISESELIELQNGNKTMYSRMASTEQTVKGLNQKYTDVTGKYDAVSKQYTSLDTKVGEYKFAVDGFSANLSQLSTKVTNNYSTTTDMQTYVKAQVDGLSTVVSNTYVKTDTLKGYSTTEQTKSIIDQKIGGISLAIEESYFCNYCTNSNFDNNDFGWKYTCVNKPDILTKLDKRCVMLIKYKGNSLSGLLSYTASLSWNYTVNRKQINKFTFKLYSTNPGTINVYLDNVVILSISKADIIDEWKEFSIEATVEKGEHTFKVKSEEDNKNVYIAEARILARHGDWSESKLTILNNSITAEVKRASDAEGEMSSKITQTADLINSKVSKGSIISEINQSAESVSISASKINFNGLVTANNRFKIKTDGSFEAVYGTLGGWNIKNGVMKSNDQKLTLDPANNRIYFDDDDDDFVTELSPNGTRTNYLTVDGGVIENPTLLIEAASSSRIAFYNSFSSSDEDEIRLNGNLEVLGTKSRVARTENFADRLLYCYETPTPMFGDLGCGKTNDRGIAIVDIDPAFSETINSGIEYQVFLQKEGDGDIWVAEKEESYFTVRGTPNLKFSWEVKCIQKSFEHLRLDEKEVQEAAQKDNRDAKKDYDIIIDTVVEDYDKEMEELINESN